MKQKLFLLITMVPGLILESTAQLKIGDQPTQQQKSVALDVKGSSGKQGLWLPRISDTTDASGIDGLNPPDGMLIYHTSSQNLMVRLNNYWVPLIKTDTSINNIYANGITKVTGPDIKLKVGNNAGTTNDFNLAASNSSKEITINLPDASATARGAVTTGPQTFNGAKTFGSGVTVNSGSTLNGGATVTGANNFTSNLTLGVNSATTPGIPTDKVLSVNSAGNVTLTSVSVVANTTVKLKAFDVGFATNEQLKSGDYAIYTFAAPSSMTLSLSSSVVVSPVASMDKNFKINWARVKDASTVEISVAAGNVPNNFNPGQGMAFRVTILEY